METLVIKINAAAGYRNCYAKKLRQDLYGVAECDGEPVAMLI